jgi:hypothetical protein
MASNDYPRPECQVSLLEVVKAAGLELQELRARHRAVTKRIRNLRIAVGALRQMRTRGIAARMEQASRSSRLGRTSQAEHRSSDETQVMLQTRDIALLQNRDLRRACRIALLETTEPVSLDEIYARILRRGSFFFASADVAAWAIGKELNAMATEGEIRRVAATSKPRWQRIS